MTIAGWVVLTILGIRGVLGFVQDANFWYGKPINKESFKEWFKTFKRGE